MKILILGEAGARPWYKGSSSERLWRWFSVGSHEELKEIATLRNVYDKKVGGELTPTHAEELWQGINRSDAVFMVGRVAQYFCMVRSPLILFKIDKFIGLPHPSGLNRQLNELSDMEIQQFINTMLEEVRRGKERGDT